MGLFTKDIRTLDDLFVHQLKDVYYAEKRIAKTLPEMIRKSTNPQLKEGFETHLEQTKSHIRNVEAVFRLHGIELDAFVCPAIDGIIKEAEEVVSEVADASVLDDALIASAQALEHYEMTQYGTLIAWANRLGRSDCASVLEKNLQDVKEADAKFTRLAEAETTRAAA